MQVLETRSYEVKHAPLDPSLPEAVRRDRPQLAILALDGSPEGHAAYKGLRAEPDLKGVPAVVCTSQEAIRAEAQAAKDRVIALPLDRDALLAALEHAARPFQTILVADDEPLIRRMFSMYLGNEGYRVVTAENGDDAIRKVREVLPDLVITDIKMPLADGYEVCRAIKTYHETQGIPVIIVSALGTELDIDKGFNAGANEYLTKPVDLVELAGRIQNIFRGIALRGRERILVVTPSQIERSVLDYGLKQQGFEVLSARDGQEAAEHAQKEIPGVILCDLEIPGTSIVELRDQLRASSKTKDIPFVVLTSRTSKVDKVKRDRLDAAAFLTKPFPIERMVALIERILGERRTKLELERELLIATIRSLVQALEARDRYTRGHSDNVARYTMMIADHFYDTDDELKRIELSAQLHDIGKIGIPDSILLNPGKLSDAEMAVMKTHPEKGEEILKPIPSLQDILPGVRWHHERMDGRGYPDGLRAEDIPLQARIIAVADTFDAITSDRPYRRGMPIEKAVAVMKSAAGDQLDPECVEVFLRALEKQGALKVKVPQEV